MAKILIVPRVANTYMGFERLRERECLKQGHKALQKIRLVQALTLAGNVMLPNAEYFLGAVKPEWGGDVCQGK